MFYVLPCVISFLYFFSPFSIAITSMERGGGCAGWGRGNREVVLVLFVRLFDLRLFGFVFPLPFGVWEGLRFVIVALPELFSYPFLQGIFFFSK